MCLYEIVGLELNQFDLILGGVLPARLLHDIVLAGPTQHQQGYRGHEASRVSPRWHGGKHGG